MNIRSLNEYVIFENVGRGFVNQDPSSPSGTAQTFAHAPQMKLRNEAPFPSIWDEVMKHSLFVYRKITDFIHFPKIHIGTSMYIHHLARWIPLTITQLCRLLCC